MSNRILSIFLTISLLAAVAGIGWGYWQQHAMQALSADLAQANTALRHQIKSEYFGIQDKLQRARYDKREVYHNTFMPEIVDSCFALLQRPQPQDWETYTRFLHWASSQYRRGRPANQPTGSLALGSWAFADTAWIAASRLPYATPPEALQMNLLLWVRQGVNHSFDDGSGLIDCFGNGLSVRIISPHKLNRRALEPILFMVSKRGPLGCLDRDRILVDSLKAQPPLHGSLIKQAPGIYRYEPQTASLSSTADTARFPLVLDVPLPTGGFKRMSVELKLPVE